MRASSCFPAGDGVDEGGRAGELEAMEMTVEDVWSSSFDPVTVFDGDALQEITDFFEEESSEVYMHLKKHFFFSLLRPVPLLFHFTPSVRIHVQIPSSLHTLFSFHTEWTYIQRSYGMGGHQGVAG